MKRILLAVLYAAVPMLIEIKISIHPETVRRVRCRRGEARRRMNNGIKRRSCFCRKERDSGAIQSTDSGNPAFILLMQIAFFNANQSDPLLALQFSTAGHPLNAVPPSVRPGSDEASADALIQETA